MALQVETSIPSAVLTASGNSPSVAALGVVKELRPSNLGYAYGLFCQEITATSSPTTFDETMQFLTAPQTSWTALYSVAGDKLMQFQQKTATGLEMLSYQGAVPSSLRSNYTVVGTSFTRIVNIALAG